MYDGKPEKVVLHYTEFAGDPGGCAWKFQIRLRAGVRHDIRLRVAACDKTIVSDFTADAAEIGSFEGAFRQLIDLPMKGLPKTVAACARGKLELARKAFEIAHTDDE